MGVNYSIFLVTGNAGFIPSTVFRRGSCLRRGPGVSGAENRKRSSCGVGLGFGV